MILVGAFVIILVSKPPPLSLPSTSSVHLFKIEISDISISSEVLTIQLTAYDFVILEWDFSDSIVVTLVTSYSWTVLTGNLKAMTLPDIGIGYINGISTSSNISISTSHDQVEPRDINKEIEKLKNLARLLPYSVEPYSQMQQTLDFIIKRICQAVEAQDYDVGFLQWDTMLALFVIPLRSWDWQGWWIFQVGSRLSILFQKISGSSLRNCILSSALSPGCRCKLWLAAPMAFDFWRNRRNFWP